VRLLSSPFYFLILFIAVLTGTEVSAENCQRGDLDNQFCDRNNDLVADLPLAEGRWLDPATVIFAYTPVEDPAVYRDVWTEFLDHLAQVTGKRVVFFPVQSNAAQIEAMRSGRLHVAGFNTGSTPLAVNCAGFVPFTMMAAKDGSFGYQMEIITWPGSGIDAIGDLKGRTLAFSSPTSNSGFKAPTAILRSEFNLVAGRDFATIFSGKHDNSVLGVVHRDYDAGAIANSVKIRMISRQVIKAADVKVLYKSETFPTTAYGHAYNLNPRLAKSVRSAFESFNWQGSRLLEEFKKSGDERFVPISYQEHWGVIRRIDAANDVSYSCR